MFQSSKQSCFNLGNKLSPCKMETLLPEFNRLLRICFRFSPTRLVCNRLSQEGLLKEAIYVLRKLFCLSSPWWKPELWLVFFLFCFSYFRDRIKDETSVTLFLFWFKKLCTIVKKIFSVGCFLLFFSA